MPKEITSTSTAADVLAKLKKRREVHWYAVSVPRQYERKIADKLREVGLEVYVALKKEKHRWSDRIKIVDVVLTPGVIFVRNSMENKNAIFITRDVKGYMRAPGDKEATQIPDSSMADFMRLIDSNYEVKIVTPLVGDDVIVLSGPLKGLVGRLVRIEGNNQLVINLNDLFGAAFTIDPINVKKVPRGTCSDTYNDVKPD